MGSFAIRIDPALPGCMAGRHVLLLSSNPGLEKMPTGKKPASNAAKGLAKKATPAAQKTVDASDLAQAKKKPTTKPTK